MDQNRFFKWIWRFNAVALALAMLALAATFVQSYFFWSNFGAPAARQVVGALTTPAGTSKYHLRLDFGREGRTVAVLALEDSQTRSVGGGSYSGPPQSDIFNYLFVDPMTGAAHWLFPTNHQRITDTDYLTAQPNQTNPFGPTYERASGSGPVRAIVYDVVPGGDAAGAEAATKYQVYVSKPDGTMLTKFIDDSDGVPSTIQVDADKILVFYVSKGRAMAASFSLVDSEVSMVRRTLAMAFSRRDRAIGFRR